LRNILGFNHHRVLLITLVPPDGSLYEDNIQLVSTLHVIINVRGPLRLGNTITLPLAFMQWGSDDTASASMLRGGKDDRPLDSTPAMKNAYSSHIRPCRQISIVGMLLRVWDKEHQQSYACRAGQLLDRNVEEIRARRTVLAGTMNARNSKDEVTPFDMNVVELTYINIYIDRYKVPALHRAYHVHHVNTTICLPSSYSGRSRGPRPSPPHVTAVDFA
jgi:hypothetical protein